MALTIQFRMCSVAMVIGAIPSSSNHVTVTYFD